MVFPLLRSETVKKGTIVTSTESAYATVSALGINGSVHLEDENADSMIRPYTSVLQRLEGINQKLDFIYKQFEDVYDLQLVNGNVDDFLSNGVSSYSIDLMETMIDDHFERIKIFSTNNAYFIQSRQTLLEELGLLMIASSLFFQSSASSRRPSLNRQNLQAGDLRNRRPKDDDNTVVNFDDGNFANTSQNSFSSVLPNIGLSTQQQLNFPNSRDNFSVISGTIPFSISQRFLRAVQMMAHTNVLVMGSPITETFEAYGLINRNAKKDKKMSAQTDGGSGTNPKSKGSSINNDSSTIYDYGFFIYHHGSKDSYLNQSLLRLCHAFDAHLFTTMYNRPNQLQRRIDELNILLSENQKATKAYHLFFLSETQELFSIPRPNGNSLLEEWKLYLEREKIIYTTLNKFNASGTTLRISCWLLASEEDKIRQTLNSVPNTNAGEVFLIVDSHFPKKSTPPTYFRINDLLFTFQMVVNTYGLPRYKEINPGLFTIIPFPFLFGVMFGDWGHGFMLLIASALIFLMFGGGRNKNSSMSGLFVMRYFFMILGLFSMYTGLLYNEFFGIGVNLFTSRWIETVNEQSHEILFSPTSEISFPYPFGVDPAWRGASNELTYLNSFKMKFAIIAGFFQMFLGILLRGCNALYEGSIIDFISVFFPQLLFFLGFVGYLVFIVIYKWVTPLTVNKPSLINSFIGMFLMTPIVPEEELFSAQAIVQNVLLIIMLVSVPILILGKPILELLKSRNHKNKVKAPITSSALDDNTKFVFTNYHSKSTATVNSMAGHSETIMNNNSQSIDIYEMNNISDGDKNKQISNKQANYDAQANNNKNNNLANEKLGENIHEGKHDFEESFNVSIEVNKTKNKISQHSSKAVSQNVNKNIPENQNTSDDHEEDGHSFGELITHQFIESTEFLLGALSNTASYLRLWALSLAHAELTKIILEQLFMMFLTMSDDNLILKAVLLWFGGIVFVGCTTVIILLMDFIEAFLHAVRLQWVEFQNKFFAADGIEFQGFSFKNVLQPPISI